MTMKVEYRQDAVITLTDIDGSRYTFHLLEVEDLRIDKRDYQCTAKVHGFYDCIYITKEDYYELKKLLDNCSYMKETNVLTYYEIVR